MVIHLSCQSLTITSQVCKVHAFICQSVVTFCSATQPFIWRSGFSRLFREFPTGLFQPGLNCSWCMKLAMLLLLASRDRPCYQQSSAELCRCRHFVTLWRPAATTLFHGQERYLATEPSLWPAQSYGTVYQQQLVKLTACIRLGAS